MRLTYQTRDEARTKADEVHQHMISTNPEYAKSVTEGRTLAFAIPYQDLDKDGKPIDTLWHINFKERHMPSLDQEELAELKPVKK
jgi:hypothetical protein